MRLCWPRQSLYQNQTLPTTIRDRSTILPHQSNLCPTNGNAGIGMWCQGACIHYREQIDGHPKTRGKNTLVGRYGAQSTAIFEGLQYCIRQWCIWKVNQSGAVPSFLTNKYTAWLLFKGVVLFWQYRWKMYQQTTSREIANVAAMALQQDSLQKTIQETLSTVANSPETLVWTRTVPEFNHQGTNGAASCQFDCVCVCNLASSHGNFCTG